jgi:hypothetical protein
VQSEDVQTRAAELAFAMLRFTQPAARPWPSSSAHDGGKAGVDLFVFAPSWRRTPRAEVVPLLLRLSPLAIFPTISRGSVALMTLEELQGERKRWLQKTLDNQRSALYDLAGALNLTGESRVLLEFADEEHLFSFADLQEWGGRYGVGVGWNLGLCGDARAEARMMLFGPDGLQCWGGPCPLRPHD